MSIDRIRSYILFLFMFLFLALRINEANVPFVTRVLTPIIFVTSFLITGTKLPRFGNVQWAYIIFISWGILTYFSATNETNYFRILQFILGIIVILFIFNNLLISKENFLAVIYGFFFGGLIVSIDALFQAKSIGAEILDLTDANRIEGSIGNANTLGGIVLLTTFTSIILFFFKKLKNSHVIIINAFLILVAIKTGSRSTLLTIFVLLFVSILYHFKGKIYKLIGISFLIIPFIFYAYNYILNETFIGYRFSAESESNDLRKELIIWGIEQINSNPIFGLGLGNFSNSNRNRAYSHNDIIEVITTTGIIGFILYSFFIISFYLEFKNLNKNEFLVGNDFLNGYNLKIVGFLFLIVFLISGLFKPLYMDITFLMMLFIIYSYKKNCFQ